MPTPPKESIGGKMLSSIINKTKQIKITWKDSRKCFDLLMALAIFLLTAIELRSFYKWLNDVRIIPAKYWDYYALSSYPYYNTWGFFIVASFFMANIIRYKSCTDTKIITCMYFIIQLVNVIFIELKLGSDLYSLTIYPAILFSIALLITIKALRWLFTK